MLSIVLEALKFIALGIGATSGLVGTLTETRDKATGKLTRGGRMIVTLIVSSGVVAATTQSIELYLKRVADRADQARRMEEFEALYTLTHPLGDLGVQISVRYPVEKGELEDDWFRRVRASTKMSLITLSDQADPLQPRRYTLEDREVNLLVQPEFYVWITRAAKKQKTNLMFRSATPQASIVRVYFDEKILDCYFDFSADRITDDARISSWRDLYGAEVTVQLPVNAPEGTKITRCQLSFSTTLTRSSPRVIDLIFTDSERRPGAGPYVPISYVRILSDDELGPKPTLLHEIDSVN